MNSLPGLRPAPGDAMALSMVLSSSSRLRYATGALMYFAQGIPQGLLSIAIPAWLASLGVSPSDIATYLAVIILPWAFKLVTGPLMDRYEFLPMGRRRPWVLGAQFGLSLSLLALMAVKSPADQIGLLMLIGVLINSFAATQDVAVDGMAIDLTPTREQGRLNASMSFGKAMGWASTSAVSGWLLVNVGIQATAIAAASTAGAVFVLFVFVLENEGERRLPWSAGRAAISHKAGQSFRAVFGGLNQVLWGRTSLVVMTIMLFDGIVVGYGQALMPIAAVNLFGYTAPQWSSLVAAMGLVGALVALALGTLIDRFGPKRMLILVASVVGAHALLLAQTQHLWQDTTYVRVMLSVWVMMLPITMVCVIALAMAICSSTISATQFAIYMSIANLGYSAGSKIYGLVAEQAGYVENYTLLAIFVVGMIMVLFFHRSASGGAVSVGNDRRARYTVGTDGSGAGMFLSGAIRCPKCRSDMEQVVQDGVEIDRCTQCHGIWFDAGEMEALRNRQSAQAIDHGDAEEGERQNLKDQYRCPRCNGTMLKVVDPMQRHIWFETCSSCNGSFLDAGEFRDLSEFTLSDILKTLAKPARE